ncbi:hypothetical protein ITP53_12930 [Nonomuraea sp. K274]|uniref:Uncharacterized protein n=1 Tax=Nonomuraea cypriaca TaxID=1187855 RepID=A0A931A7V4_9ACTN|nr:hypothetical protein [Nonomuraea cypriaca]MBF8186630.1 hypothetical protein [Nonomuraea cypriaca]
MITSPPNRQGFVLLRTLDRLRRLGDPADVLGAGAGRLAAVFAAATAVRDHLLADPRFAEVDTAVLM